MPALVACNFNPDMKVKYLQLKKAGKPPKVAITAIMRKVKGRSSHKIQLEFPVLRKRYWGRHFWGRGYFSTTRGAITDDTILQYLESHSPNPTDASR
jgi:putative transposase